MRAALAVRAVLALVVVVVLGACTSCPPCESGGLLVGGGSCPAPRVALR